MVITGISRTTTTFTTLITIHFTTIFTGTVTAGTLTIAGVHGITTSTTIGTTVIGTTTVGTMDLENQQAHQLDERLNLSHAFRSSLSNRREFRKNQNLNLLTQNLLELSQLGIIHQHTSNPETRTNTRVQRTGLRQPIPNQRKEVLFVRTRFTKRQNHNLEMLSLLAHRLKIILSQLKLPEDPGKPAGPYK